LANPRKPKAKALVEASEVKNPKRFRDRKEPKVTDAIGNPPEWFGGEERVAWRQFQTELPWLNGSHRALLEIAATVRARLAKGEDVSMQALNLLRQCLGQMGATPADATKVSVPDDGEEDPDEALFNR
jgi:hypothetical protein